MGRPPHLFIASGNSPARSRTARPFLVSDASPTAAYRLFFGVKASNGTYSTRSITEEGRREYQTAGPRQTFTHFEEADRDPSEIAVPSALPVAFHPAGHLLLWEDASGCFQVARYDRDYWKSSAPLFKRRVCEGAVSVTPNGLGLIHWTPGADGIELILNRGLSSRRDAQSARFASMPSPVADGKGIVGVVAGSSGVQLAYIPIDIPLPDSVNAWMYSESAADTALFAANGGLFRNLNEHDQLYQLYDTESYSCGKLDESTPTRPYLVTTDSFWELFAAAYEGIFILRERQSAIPAFREFIRMAAAESPRSNLAKPWPGIFAALEALQNNPDSNDEARRILRATGAEFSPLLGADFDYAELKPRGHYSATPESERYFRSFRYLTRVAAQLNNTANLRNLPPAVKSAAMRWVSSYSDLIAPSRSPLVWEEPAARQSPPVLFPLSWGFDNETLDRTIFHSSFPEPEQIQGLTGPRLQPSALDVAAALGSRFARDLLADEVRRYPPLDAALNRLASHSPEPPGSNLYNNWIESLAVQWADSTPSPNGPGDTALWRAKRLQTGLASWATLRHATVLVNERVSAECGEGGFEFIVLRPPRGYVEPDPATFGRIANLFDAAIRLVTGSALQGNLPLSDVEDQQARQSLRQGLVRRLSETAAKARLFQSIALKETRGQTLTPQDYEEILYVGRVAEHHFLVYKMSAPVRSVRNSAGFDAGPLAGTR